MPGEDDAGDEDEQGAGKRRMVDARLWLQRWVERPDTFVKSVANSVKQAVDPRLATDAEKILVHAQLVSEPRRAALADLLQNHTDADLATEEGRTAFIARVPDRAHAARLRNCFAFEHVRWSALRAAQTVSNAIAGGAQRSDILAAREDVDQAFTALGSSCDNLQAAFVGDAPAEAVSFCLEQGMKQPLDSRIAALAGRVPLVFSVVDGRIDQGLGYTRKPLVADDAYEVVEGEEPRPDLRGVPRPLMRLRSLLADTGAPA